MTDGENQGGQGTPPPRGGRSEPKWPDFRSDLLAIFAALLTVGSALVGAWAYSAYTLAVCLFAAAFPRMEGRFMLKSGPTALQGHVRPKPESDLPAEERPELQERTTQSDEG